MRCDKCSGLMYLDYSPDLKSDIDGCVYSCYICGRRKYTIPGKSIEDFKNERIKKVSSELSYCYCGKALEKFNRKFCSLKCFRESYGLLRHKCKLKSCKKTIPKCNSFFCSKGCQLKFQLSEKPVKKSKKLLETVGI